MSKLRIEVNTLDRLTTLAAFAQLAQGIPDGSIQLTGRAANGEFDAGSAMFDCDRRQPPRTGFEQAALVGVAALVAVFIVEMHLDAGELVANMLELLFQHALHAGEQLGRTDEVLVRIELYLLGIPSVSMIFRA